MLYDRSRRVDAGALFFAVAVLVGVAAVWPYNYLLFHSLVETFSVVVACGIFMVVWNARRVLDNGYLLFVGIGFLFVGVLDLLHMLSYFGMGVFRAPTPDLATQLWIQARFLQAGTLLLAPLFIGRQFRSGLAFGGFAVVTGLLLLSVFYCDVFPACYLPNVGLTPFKKISEAVISLMLIGAMALLLRNRLRFDHHMLKLLVWSIGFTVASELAFTLYTRIYGPLNMLGHVMKVLAFYLIYVAVIETSIARPRDVFFRDLQESERALRASELHFRRMVDESPGGVVVAGRDGIVKYVNPAAEALFGRSAGELVGGDFGHPLLPGKAIALDITRPDGQTIIAGMYVVETQWDGHPCYLASLHDITQHRA
jgi:PAS domain-containing protein